MAPVLIILVVAILAIILIANFTLTTLGLVIAVWGFYELSVNRKLKAKSWAPVVILSVGILIAIVGLGPGGSNTASNEDVAHEPEQTEALEEEDTNEMESTEDANTVESDESADTSATENEDTEETSDEENSATAHTTTESQPEPKPEPEPAEDKSNATVTRVIDGDTLEVSMDGKTEDVRLLLIDTPETVHPNEPVQPFGPEASQFVKNTLSGEEVYVQVGKEELDNYGRLLAYVFIDGKTIQEKLLSKGLARTAYLYNDLTMLDDFHKAQQPAKDSGIGVWSIEGYAHKDHDHGYHYEEPAPEAESDPEPETEPQTESVYFKNCTAAREAGAAPVRVGDPGYGTHLDRDGDGVGCE